jgi:hypothetical protein
VRQAAGDDFELVPRAVDIRVTASRERVVVAGSVPVGSAVPAPFSAPAAAR